jgi:hypothetical protein
MICTCPVEASVHHPSCPRDGLLRDVGAFELSTADQSVTTDVRARAMRASKVSSDLMARNLQAFKDEAARASEILREDR